MDPTRDLRWTKWAFPLGSPLQQQRYRGWTAIEQINAQIKQIKMCGGRWRLGGGWHWPCGSDELWKQITWDLCNTEHIPVSLSIFPFSSFLFLEIWFQLTEQSQQCTTDNIFTAAQYELNTSCSTIQYEVILYKGVTYRWQRFNKQRS